MTHTPVVVAVGAAVNTGDGPDARREMAYDEALADRICDVLTSSAEVTEIKMFGGLVFMVHGHMACGVVHDDLMLRLGPDGADAALGRPHVRPMEFTGRPMTGMVLVDPAGLTGTALEKWVHAAAAYVRQLPPRAAKPRRSARPAAKR